MIVVQGCPHRCEGCHNPQTHDFSGGNEVSAETILSEIKSDPLLSGVTFSGGEPFCQAEALAELAKEIHALGLDLMVYSGWTLEQLQEKAKKEEGVKALLEQTDILVDGPFILAERDLELDFRGSRNQRVLYLT
ncbi:MAG: radical SAM protein [Firmicutes bacterium]|nr:radical SAM protein [Bacillota bacterium]